MSIGNEIGDMLGQSLRERETENTDLTKADSIISDIKILDDSVKPQGLHFKSQKRSPFGESGSDYRLVLGHPFAGILGGNYNVIENFENLDNVGGYNSDSVIVLGSAFVKNGYYSASLIGDGSPRYSDQGIDITLTPTLDLGSKIVEVYWYIKDTDVLGSIDRFDVKMDSAIWRFEDTVGSFGVGWNKISVDTTTTPTYNSLGSPVSEIQLVVRKTSSSFEFIAGDMYFDLLTYADDTTSYNPLGSNYSEYENILIKQIDDIYREYLDSETFYDSGSSTGSWAVGSYIKLERALPEIGSYTYTYVTFDTGSFVDTGSSFSIGSQNVEIGTSAFDQAVYISNTSDSYVSFDTEDNVLWGGSAEIDMIIKMDEIKSGSTYPFFRQYSETCGSREFGINTVGAIYINHKYPSGSEESWTGQLTGSANGLYRRFVYSYGHSTLGIGSELPKELNMWVDETHIIDGLSYTWYHSGGSALGYGGSVIIGPDSFAGSVDNFIMTRAESESGGRSLTGTYVTTDWISYDAGSFTNFALTTGSASGPLVKITAINNTGSEVIFNESNRGGIVAETSTTNTAINFNKVKFKLEQQSIGVDPTVLHNKDSAGKDTTAIQINMI